MLNNDNKFSKAEKMLKIINKEAVSRKSLNN